MFWETFNMTLFWFLLGIALFIIELLVPGFILVFFGVGAWITAICHWTGLTSNFTVEVTIFIVSSVLTLLLFRKNMANFFKGKESGKMTEEEFEAIKGKKAVVRIDIKPGMVGGKVEFNGTLWNAESDFDIQKDEVVEIVERKNLLLKVKPVNK
jgi:membrane protein implicated in regulation of membrane protease activity